MDLTNYTGLKDAIADFLDRDDLTAQIPGFIALAEAKIKRRVRRKTIRTTFNITAEETTLPTTCGELRSIYPLTGDAILDLPIKIGTPEQLAEVRARHLGVTGRPVAASIVDTKIVVAPAPDQTYSCQVTFYEKLVPLSGGNADNSILIEAPDIYLYGALYEAAPYLQHDERIAVWEDYFEKGVTELDTARMREELNASYRPARLPVVF